MNKREMAIVSAYTGILMGNISDMHQYVEEVMERSVFTHEFTSKKFNEEMKAKVKPDFLALCAPSAEPNEMISVSKDDLMEVMKNMNWAKHTIKDKLKFGQDESTAVYAREKRCYGVLLTETKKLAEMLGEV